MGEPFGEKADVVAKRFNLNVGVPAILFGHGIDVAASPSQPVTKRCPQIIAQWKGLSTIAREQAIDAQSAWAGQQQPHEDDDV